MKHITLLPSPAKGKSRDIAAVLSRALHEQGFETYVIEDPGCELPHQTELAIVLGGDGAMLDAARLVYPAQVPLLGVNLGRLGFLADAQPGEVAQIATALAAGDYRLEERMMLEANVVMPGREVPAGPALNEFAFLKKALSQVVELEVRVGGDPAATYRCDGLIVATPTGSTAYSLSAGGPILNPTLEAIVVTPICAHSLNARSIVLRADEEVQIRPVLRPGQKVLVMPDGRRPVQLGPDGRVIIKRSACHTCLLRLKRTHFYRSLWSRMGAADF